MSRTEEPPSEGTDLDKLFAQLNMPLPVWLKLTLLILITVGGIGAGVGMVLAVWRRAKPRVTRWWQRKRQDQRRADRRARFADHIEGRMRRLGEKEEWRDNQYAELEAEIEVRRPRRRALWRRSAEPDIRREPSLSTALRTVSDKLVVLEGDPGAGKSVALRHLTAQLALGIVRQPNETDPLPLYVNLKELTATGDVTASHVRDLVFASVNQGRDRQVDRFLDDEFDAGLEAGTWLFLFDSFDEIPAILGATEADTAIEKYSDAIYEFLHGFNACRGIIASREFRGPPRKYNWPKFRIMALSWDRKVELVRKADLTRAQETEVLEGLRDAAAEVYAMSDNPMFLGLLCEYMRDGNTFPENAHVVMESFVHERFVRDANRIRDIFAVEPTLVRAVAEELAFRIADHTTLGLTVHRGDVKRLLADRFDPEELAAALDALEYTKLARSHDDAADLPDDHAITFSHRRLQEYFATCVVLREPERVPPATLISDGRWRETAVTILQSQSAVDKLGVYEAANAVLASFGPVPEEFDWQPGQFHVLNVLSEGGGSSQYPDSMPELVDRVDTVLAAAWASTRMRDRKWALEICSAGSPALALRLVTEAFQGRSQWLREQAYSQVRRLQEVSSEIHAEVRQSLIDFSLGGELRRSRTSIRSQVNRIPNPDNLLQAMRLLLATLVIDTLIGILLPLAVVYATESPTPLVMVPMWMLMGALGRSTFARPAARVRWIRARTKFLDPNRIVKPSLPKRRDRQKILNEFAGLFFLVVARPAYMVLSWFLLNYPVTDVTNTARTAVITWALSFVFTLWTTGAYMGIQEGRRLTPKEWPLLTALPVRPMIRSIRSIGARAVAEAGLIALSIGGAIGAFVLIVYVLEDQLRAILPVLVALGTGLVIAMIVRAVVLHHRERKLARVELGAHETVTAAWLASKLCAVRSRVAVMELLENIRLRTPKPTWDPDALALVLHIADAVSRIGKDHFDVKAAQEEFATTWAPFGLHHKGGLDKYASATVLDEIARVHEDVSSTSLR